MGNIRKKPLNIEVCELRVRLNETLAARHVRTHEHVEHFVGILRILDFHLLSHNCSGFISPKPL